MMSTAMTRIVKRTALTTPAAARPTAPPRRRRRWLLLLLPGLLTVGAVAWLRLERSPETLCRQWEREARFAEGARLTEIMTRLDAYGRLGLPSVVRLLDAEREAATEAAGEVLTARLRLVGRHGKGDDRAAAALIADEVQKLVAGRRQAVSPAMVDVALELLEAVGRLGLADAVDGDLRGRMLATCDEVLRLAPGSRESPLKTLVSFDSPLPPLLPQAPDDSSAEKAAKEEAARPAAVAKVAPPEASTAPAAPMPVLADESPKIAANSAARINPIRDGETDPHVIPATASASLPSADALRPGSARGDAWSLFAALHDDAAPSADQELRRRGFTPQEIELGRHLCSPDAEERQYFASRLPTLGGIDARPWLLYLSRDEDDEVRLTVAAILATSGDPELQARVRAMSIDDHDERVRATAARAVDTRTLRR